MPATVPKLGASSRVKADASYIVISCENRGASRKGHHAAGAPRQGAWGRGEEEGRWRPWSGEWVFPIIPRPAPGWDLAGRERIVRPCPSHLLRRRPGVPSRRPDRKSVV